MSRTSFQTKLILAALAAPVLALVVAGLIFSTTMRRVIDARIERTLVAEARLAAELLSTSPLTTAATDVPPDDLQREASRMGPRTPADLMPVMAASSATRPKRSRPSPRSTTTPRVQRS